MLKFASGDSHTGRNKALIVFAPELDRERQNGVTLAECFDGLCVLGLGYVSGEHLLFELSNFEQIQISNELVSYLGRSVVARNDAVSGEFV